MDDSEDNLSAEDITKVESPTTLRLKSKKRSLVERELETNLTARVTSPVSNGEGTSTSRYGRARRLKTEAEFSDSRKIMLEVLKSSGPEKSPVKVQSPVYKMHASNSPIHLESPKKPTMEMYLDNQIENIYQENISLSRFGSEETFKPSPVKKHPKIYIRKDLIQNRDPEEAVMLIKNIFSPTKSAQKASSSHISNVLERSSEKYSISASGRQVNGHIDNLSVVKTLDFDNKKKKKESKEKNLSKSDLFELEAKCLYQVGDLAWARMGTYPFWPCIVTRDPSHGIFVKKKLYGRIERDIIHVTFFGDNGRRGWIVDNMLKKFMGLAEFESAREKFTPEDKKRDPRLYAAFFISDKKQSLWYMSVQEAETLFKEPKRLRIDILNDMLENARSQKNTPKTLKSGKITRTDSDVSLSESLYDTLFSEDDGKTDDSDRSRNKIRNKSLDVSEVVTACLDNMAAKTGITKIQRQSHMDRWLQKAKSKTPEKMHTKPSIMSKDNKSIIKLEHSKKKKIVSSKDLSKHYSLRRSTYESQNLLSHQNEHDYYNNLVSNNPGVNLNNLTNNENDNKDTNIVSEKHESQVDDKEKDHVDVKYEDIMLETDSIIAHEIVLENERNSITDSEADSSSLHEVNNVLFSEVPETDIDSISDTQDSCFSTEKSTETETSDIDSQSQTDSIVIYNSKTEKNDKNDNGCFSASSDESTMSLQSCNTDQPKLSDKDIDNNKDLIYTDNSIDSTYTDISNKVDIDMFNMDGDQGIGRKESIQSLSLQLGNEFNLGSTIHANNMDNSISEMSVDEDDTKEMMSTNSNNVKDQDEIFVKDSIEKDTSTNDTFITVTELEESNQNGAVAESLMREGHKITVYDNSNVSFQNCINYNKCFYEDDGSNLKENAFTSEETQSDEENTINTTSDNDTVAEIPNKNEDSVSDLINQNYCEVINTNEDTDGGNSTISNKSEVTPDISKSFIENKHIIDSNKVKLDNLNAKSDDDDVFSSEIDGNSDVKNLGIRKKDTFNYTINENGYHESDSDFKDGDCDTASVSSEDSPTLFTRNRQRLQLKRNKETKSNSLEDPEFIKYLEISRDALMDEHPELSYDEIIAYLHKTWLYEQSKKTDLKKSDNIDHSNFVKGLDEAVRKKRYNRKTNKPLESSKSKEVNKQKRYPEWIVSMNCEKTHKITLKMPVVTERQASEENNKEVFPININNLVDNIEIEIPQTHSNENNVFDSNLMGSDTIDNQQNSPVKLEKKHDSLNICRMPSLSEPKRDINNSAEKTKCIESVIKKELDIDKASMDFEVRDIPLIYRKLQLKAKPESIISRDMDIDQNDVDADNVSVSSEDSDRVLSKRKQKYKVDKKFGKGIDDPEFIKYLELRQDALIDENPQLNQDEITNYLFKTWLYEENVKHELKKTEEIEQLGLVKGLKDERLEIVPPKRVKKKIKVPRDITDFFEIAPRNKPQRSTAKHYYNEDLFDLDDEIESFERTKDRPEIKSEITGSPNNETQNQISVCSNEIVEYVDQDLEDNVNEVELYFAELTQPKPNIFKGLLREKVCEICENTGNLIKCKSCHGMFHIDCVKKQTQVIDVPVPPRGRRKKKKAGRRPKGLEDVDNHGDDKIQDLSEEHIDDFEPEARTVDAEVLEAQLSAKMKEILDNLEPPENYSYSSDEEMDWRYSVPGKCEIVDVKLKLRTTEVLDFSDFKCNNCQKYDTPVCFVCKSAISKKESKMRQRCQVPHCHKFYHIDCLEHWPQTQFNAGEPSKNNKKINEHFEALTCPRHVCHTCVSDDPRGCKTRFSGDKLAKCVRCPATYHSFTKCIPAGTQILTASHIICPRHYEHRPGKVPCHVNTGWCFICALGGSLICCEYCPTSFHAECLNIDPPEGGYMCEDCETGRLPLYGEMVWVKLGHYRWWPGIILHPSEIPLNILAVKHRLGEFVVRFFGQYDHYWVNRGRVFPFQEGDSGRISSQRSKIDAAFTMAMEHAQRACEILKSAIPNEEESLDIASSLLPPHYVKLKVNKPCGSLCGRKLDDPELSLTQCECNPDEEDPCGLYSQCLNRMLLTECGPTCKAGDRCNNRAFEKRLYPKLVPYRTPHRGWGLKTLDDIKSGQFVIEYVGELIDEEEFKRRMRRKHEIRDENFYFLTLDKERMIDAGPKGNLARFMNHCCEPNCETQKWTVLGDVRVGLFAIKDIPANTEVTFNYNLECAGIEKKRCLCGAKRCSGYIGAKPKQDESQTKKGKVPAKRTYKKQKAETPPSATKAKPKKPLGRPPKPKELSEIEKDLLIIRNATNGLSSDESCRSLSSEGDRNPRALKRKRVSFSTEEVILYNGAESPSLKRQKLYEKDVGD